MSLDVQIEGVLFYKAAPVKISALSRMFSVSEGEVQEALQKLQNRLTEGGIRLVSTDTEVELRTAGELSELIENLRKDEMKKEIGKAGAETLAIILYRGTVSRSEIDSIRGVNSSFILRNLLTRGLIQREGSAGRSYAYSVTPDLLAHLGITKREELPQFTEIMDALDTFETQQEESSETRSLFNAETS
ncbi:SMC-Scp complex subunit ScpB [Candidatus Kaiserbacteria bacterium]|nr:SMC-Scp complex subunit ScpB [Candidatus Kaiserbacteria bacterium]